MRKNNPSPDHPWKGRVLPPTLLLIGMQGTSEGGLALRGPDQHLDERELREHVLAAIGTTLQGMCFHVVNDCYIRGMTIPEVMAERELSRAQVKNLLVLGLALLRRSPRTKRILREFLNARQSAT